MQVNLHYHGDAFTDLTEAFDPETNVAYAADFLKTLYQQTGSWSEATGRYHSGTPELGGPYRARVLAMWNNQRGLRELAAIQRRMRLLPLSTETGRAITLEQKIEMLREALAATPNDERPIPLREIWLRMADRPVLIGPASPQKVASAKPGKAPSAKAAKVASGGATAPVVVRVTRSQDGNTPDGKAQDEKAFADKRIAYLQAWREQQQRDQEAASTARSSGGRNVSILRGDDRAVERVQTR